MTTAQKLFLMKMCLHVLLPCVIYHFHLFLCSFILITFRLCDASASIPCSLFHNQQPLSLHPPSSIPCPPSILHHSSLITPSLSFLSSILHLSLTTCSIFCLPTPCPLFCSILIFSTPIHFSLPPHSNCVYLTFCPL